MRAGFVGSRETVLVAIARMGAASCSYSIGEWVRRCDCKYGVADAKTWPTFGERGNGCPELRSLWTIVDALTDDEWSLLTRRAGGIPSGSLFRTADIASRLHAADAAASMAQANIAAIREALQSDPTLGLDGDGR